MYARSLPEGPLRQGEILSNVVEVRPKVESLRGGNDEVEFDENVHPLALVLSQDCDLDWDYRARSAAEPQQEHMAAKILPNILLCELWPADQLRGRQSIKSDIWRRLRQNQDERYHFLRGAPEAQDATAEGFPDLAIDFKRVFTVGAEEMYYRLSSEVKRRCRLMGPFMQDLSNRFGYYQLRVALPEAAAQPAKPHLRGVPEDFG